jgi:succinoglycan biosynthesis protein ExoA
MTDEMTPHALVSTERCDEAPHLPPTVIIVPALNESAYIIPCLESLLAQRGCTVLEIIIADGGSTDDTVAQVRALARNDPRIRVVDNPERIQSAGFNRAASIADPVASVLVRADAHVTYPSRFVAACLGAMVAHGATSVVVPMRTIGVSGFQRAVAAAQSSFFGNGGAAHRADGKSRFVEHGHHAAFDRAFFTLLAGYDESFSHNEDAEFDYRVRKAGGRIWMCAEARVNYYPRRTVQGLARQYVANGRGRARTVLTHRMRPGPRQMAPVALLPALAMSVLLAPVWPESALVSVSYVTLCSVYGIMIALRARDGWLLATGPATIVMHLCFAYGFLRTVGENLMVPRRSKHEPSQLNQA